MNLSLISIYTGGVLTVLMVFFHSRFTKIFNWKKDFDRITEKNKKIFCLFCGKRFEKKVILGNGVYEPKNNWNNG